LHFAGAASIPLFWLSLAQLAGDSRLNFPCLMSCAALAAWRWGWKGAVAGGMAFLGLRAAAGAPAPVLSTEALGTALSLAAALAARRSGPAGSAAAGSLTALAALLL
jgi:hypothetical protein